MRRLSVAVGGLALVAVLAACEDEPEESGDRNFAIGSGDTYVALGDSYTAAPRTGTTETSDGCYQSATNYPHRIAESTGATLHDNSCTGATTDSLTGSQVTALSTRPPQLDDVDEDTDLVTIRVGGNDFGLFGRIINCARFFGPEKTDSPCTNFDASVAETSVANALPEVERRLVGVLEDIAERGPDARILVVGYPQVVPQEGTCELLPLPAGDYAYGRRIMEGLNSALESAADAVDATYIDMYAASEGHDICADEPWIAGAAAKPEGATAWHPYVEEGEAVAELVLAELED